MTKASKKVLGIIFLYMKKDCCTSHYVQQPHFITLLHAISHATAHFVTFLFIKIYYLSIIRYSYLFA